MLVSVVVLAPGKCTVSQARRVMGPADKPGFGRCHDEQDHAFRWRFSSRKFDGLPSSASRRAVGIVGSGSGVSDAPSLIKRCAVRSGHQGPVLAVLAMLATKRRLRVAPRGCALPLTAAAHGTL